MDFLLSKQNGATQAVSDWGKTNQSNQYDLIYISHKALCAVAHKKISHEYSVAYCRNSQPSQCIRPITTKIDPTVSKTSAYAIAANWHAL
jgi:hypothetical protein